MSTVSQEKLPKFSKPPVVETVLGVQFNRIEGLTDAHLGAFWHELGADWPNVRHAPRLDEQFELFGEEQLSWRPGSLQLRLTQNPASRLFIKNPTEDALIQIQDNRFHYNWTGGHGGHDYPNYEKVKPEFDEAYQKFINFLDAQALEEIRPNQWEVTYVNHIPRGSVWERPDDWAKLFPNSVILQSNVGQINLEGIQAQWHFEIHPQKGRLHVELQSGRRAPDQNEDDLLIMKLTARGPIPFEDNGTSLNEGLNLGHEIIVRSFKALTSEEAHITWGAEIDANS